MAWLWKGEGGWSLRTKAPMQRANSNGSKTRTPRLELEARNPPPPGVVLCTCLVEEARS